jgi:hypothetical protein
MIRGSTEDGFVNQEYATFERWWNDWMHRRRQMPSSAANSAPHNPNLTAKPAGKADDYVPPVGP